MDICIIASSGRSANILKSFAKALNRNSVSWAIFFTGDGVCELKDEKLVKIVIESELAITCEESWKKHFPDKQCPIKLGSQTDNSFMIGSSDKVLSL